MGENILTLTDQNFHTEVSNSKLPVLVDFWADWCGPCQMLAPVLNDLAGDFMNRVLIGKLNVDQNRQTAANFGVMSIPTLILFQDGKEITRITGFRPKQDLSRLLEQYLD